MTYLAAIGLAIGALFIGLWLGERGRRRDLQWIAEAALGPRDRGPVIADTPTTEEEDLGRVVAIEKDELSAHLFEIAQRDGNPVTIEEAEAEAERLIAEELTP